MNRKKSAYGFGLKLLLGLLVVIGLTSPLTAQKDRKPDRKKFGWSLKKAKKESKKESKNDSKNDSRQSGQKDGIDDDETVKIDTDLVLNDVLVLDKKGEAVLGLKESDFIVIEEDQPQKIEVFSAPAAEQKAFPRHFLFVIDHNNGLIGHMRNSIDAAKLFVDKLDPQDKMAIVNDDVKLIQDFTGDKIRLKKKLEEVYKDYTSPYRSGWGLSYTALHTALNELFDEPAIRPIVIMQTNGRDLYFLKNGKQDASRSKFGLYYGFHNFTFEELLEKIIEKRATVYSVITGRRFAGLPDEEKIKNLVLMQIDYQYDWTPVKLESIVPLEKASDHLFVRRILQEYHEFQLALTEIAQTSGGSAKFLQTPEDAKTVYADIFADAASRYLIGFYSTDRQPDKKIRKVKIEVRGQPEFVVLGRKSYIAR